MSDPFEFLTFLWIVGSSRTRSSNSLVTDSAAGATAFACAIKTYNGAIGVVSFTFPNFDCFTPCAQP